MSLLQTWFRPCHTLEAAHQTCQSCQLLQLDRCNTKPSKSYRSYPAWHLELLKSTPTRAFPSQKMMFHQEVFIFRIIGWESLNKVRKQKNKQLKYWPKRLSTNAQYCSEILIFCGGNHWESKGQEEEKAAEKDTCRFYRKIWENKRNLGEQREKKPQVIHLLIQQLAEFAYPSLFQRLWNFVFLQLFFLSFWHVFSSHAAI